MKRKLDFAIMIAVITVVTLVVGCDNLIKGDPVNFDEWMTCTGPQKSTTGDLVWITFDITASSAPLPGDTISLSMWIQNLYDSTQPENPNIPLSSNLRVFMEDTGVVAAGSMLADVEYEILTVGTSDFTLVGAANNAVGDIFTATGPTDGDGTVQIVNMEGVGTIGPEDWFLGEFVIPGLFADKMHVIVENVTIPRTNHFPNVIPGGNPPPDLGYPEVKFKVYGLLDAENCILERTDDTGYDGEANNLFEATVNGGDTLNVTNPYLPNLQIKFLQRTPTSPIPHTGGMSITEWEVLNAGIGPVDQDFMVNVFLSEDDVIDKWDESLGTTTVTDVIDGNTNKLVYVMVTMPYVSFRTNGWTLFSAIVRYDPAIGDVLLTRELPPNGPPGYPFTVYPCIESTSQLIALVDAEQPSAVREAVENDNYSYQGLGGNGDMEAKTSPIGNYDIELIEFRADNYTATGGGNTSNAYDISIRYNASILYADNCSFGYYWSKNDEAQFGDYFCQRYWFQIQPGTNILLYPFGINFVWRPAPLPSPGTYRMVLVMDDIYKFDEPDENNNVKLSIGTVQVS